LLIQQVAGCGKSARPVLRGGRDQLLPYSTEISAPSAIYYLRLDVAAHGALRRAEPTPAKEIYRGGGGDLAEVRGEKNKLFYFTKNM
jgi:hypothetical protein